MKKAKRILAGALAALILTMSLPLSALADEADVPAESPSFEVSFDVDTGQEEISEDLPTEVEATPEPTPESTTEPTQSQHLRRKAPLHRPRRQNLPQRPRLHPKLPQRRQAHRSRVSPHLLRPVLRRVRHLLQSRRLRRHRSRLQTQ